MQLTKIRIGTVNGNVVIGDVNVEHTTHTHGPVYMVLPSHGGPPPGQRERRKVPRAPTEIDQRDLQQQMQRLSDRSIVLDFMERQYATRDVLELESNQLHHLRWYVEVLLRRS
ncbi:MAG: hypothetical protein V4858_08905 [Pseudomonadota bacterium]